MARFPADLRKSEAIRALERLGFSVVREGTHISNIEDLVLAIKNFTAEGLDVEANR